MHHDKALAFYQFGPAGLEIATDMQQTFFSFVTEKFELDVNL